MTEGAHADLPGVRLFHTDSGGEGPPVLLLHANTGTSASWEKQVPALVAAGFRAIAFDRRGWGRSFPVSETGVQPGSIAEGRVALLSPLAALGDIAHQPLEDAQCADLRHGRRVRATVAGERAALLLDGNVVSIADRVDGDRWQPRLVLLGASA